MFKPELEVPDIEYCKKLKDLGFPQNGGGWYWSIDNQGKVFLSFFQKMTNGDIEHDERINFLKRIKAPTVRELGEWMPSSIEKEYSYASGAKRIFENRVVSDIEKNYSISYYFIIEKVDEEWFCKYERLDYNEPVILVLFSGVKLSNALAKMLIWLIKNGYVRFENERMYKNFKKS